MVPAQLIQRSLLELERELEKAPLRLVKEVGTAIGNWRGKGEEMRGKQGIPVLSMWPRKLGEYRKVAGFFLLYHTLVLGENDEVFAKIEGEAGTIISKLANLRERVPKFDSFERAVRERLAGISQGQLLHAFSEESQRLFPVAVRRRLSAFFTRFDFAGFLARFLIYGNGKVTRILDPTCGAGVFLAAAIEQYSRLEYENARGTALEIRGNEYSPVLAFLSYLNLLTTRERLLPEGRGARGIVTVEVTRGDFLSTPSPDIPQFDLILMNPPYTSLERLPRDYATWLRAKFGGTDLAGYVRGRGMGLHQFILLKAAEFLKDGGRVALVVSESFINMVDSNGGVEFLLDHFHLEYLLSSLDDWDVSTHVGFGEIVIIARKVHRGGGAGGTGGMPPRVTKFVNLPHEFWDSVENDWSGVDFETIDGVSVHEVDENTLRGTIGAWSQYFREIKVLERILSRAENKLPSGSRVFARAREGLRARGSKVFYLPNQFWKIIKIADDVLEISCLEDPGETLLVDRRFLSPALRSPRVNDGRVLVRASHFFWVFPKGATIRSLDDEKVLEYFNWFSTRHLELIPASRKNLDGSVNEDWFLQNPPKASPPARVAVLEKFLPTSKTAVCQYLEPRVHPVGAYYYLENPRLGEDDWKVVVAWYNSSPGLLFRYKFRQVLGPSSERVLARHLERFIPCLDPRAVAGEARVNLVSWVESTGGAGELPPVERQLGTTVRESLDAWILEALGFEPSEIPGLTRELHQEIKRWCGEIRQRNAGGKRRTRSTPMN
ncbi:MAG: N-6 DNA methylase [Promethearchaeota archaeon]